MPADTLALEQPLAPLQVQSAACVVGSSLDNIDAKNRAQIAAATRLASGAVNVDDVITMTRSGIDEQIIVNQIAGAGLQRPLGGQRRHLLAAERCQPTRDFPSCSKRRVAVAELPPGTVVVPDGPPPAVVVAGRGYWGAHYSHPCYGW